jgi:excinuclease ABC subunit A
LPTVYVTCDVCNGKRFMKETLEVKYKKKSIYDVLKMTIEEALSNSLNDIPAIYDRLKTLEEVGLGISSLGSRDDALGRRGAARQNFGRALSPASCKKQSTCSTSRRSGSTTKTCASSSIFSTGSLRQATRWCLIEHNMDIIKNADWLLDFGPEGGEGGGNLVAKGTPEDVAKQQNFPHRQVS